MTFAPRLRSWVRSVVRRVRLRREMDEELRFHLDTYVEDLVRAGVPPSDARRRAHIEFGSVDARKEECREALGLRLIDEVLGDLRYAWRQLRRSPAFTAVAVISLALGIGANTAIFSLMEAALWRSIPVHRPDELRLFSWISQFNHGGNGNGRIDRTAGGGYASAPFSYPVFQELQRQNDVFETVFGVKPSVRVTAVIDGQAELLDSVLVTANFYEGVGVQPSLGRAIGVADASDASEAGAVISDGLWARRFGRHRSVIGKRISVNATPVTIVGVNPPEFTGIQPGAFPDIFLPMRLQPIVSPWYEHGSVLADADFWWVLVFGRLKPGVTAAQAEAALDVVLRRAVQTLLPDRAHRDPPRLKLLDGARGFDRLSEDFSKPLLVLFSLVGVVSLIACANVANLLLARAATRQREISLRRALGAGRWRIARQLLTEGLALACLGGAAGILLGYWLRDSIPSLLASSWTPAPFHAAFNWRVVGFAVAATTVTGILFSLAPAWRSTRLEINASLKETARVGVRLPRRSGGKPLAMCQA
ncbi:MAG: ABC transporter permease, partial [Vicinamibacteraceae bacterium]